MPYPLDHLLGKAGQHVAVAEFLRRGYNVALPEVDVGDDFLVLDDRCGGYSRIQVKTSSTKPLKTEWGFQAQFFIPARQLYTPQRPHLFYILAARLDGDEEQAARRNRRHSGRRGNATIGRPAALAGMLAETTANAQPATDRRWEFLVIARKSLLAKHRRHGFGILAGERVMLGLTFRRHTVTGHRLNLQHFRNNFARYWPRRDGGG
jgi:hypothetical protein